MTQAANKSTLRSSVVTSLGKEKNMKVPLFEQARSKLVS